MSALEARQRSRHLAAVLAIGITLSSSGIAAAVTGDPLLPVQDRRQERLRDRPPRHLGVRLDPAAVDDGPHHSRDVRSAMNLTSRSQTRCDRRPAHRAGRTPTSDQAPRRRTPRQPERPLDDQTPAAAPRRSRRRHRRDARRPFPPPRSHPAETTLLARPTTAPTLRTGTPTATRTAPASRDKPHHANNGNDNPGKPETNPGVGAGSTDDPDSCSTDGSADVTTDQQAKPNCPKPRPTHPTHPAPKPPAEAHGRHDDPDVRGRPAAGRDG